MPIPGSLNGKPTVGESSRAEQLHRMFRNRTVRRRVIHTFSAASALSLKTELHLPLLSIWHPKQDLTHFKMRCTYLHYEAIRKIITEKQIFSIWLHISETDFWRPIYKYIKLKDQMMCSVKLFNLKENLVLKIWWYLTFCQKYSLYFLIIITSKHVFQTI